MQSTFFEVDEYSIRLFSQEDDVLHSVIQSLDEAGMPQASISASQGKFLQILARSCGARRILEVGTLGGYSSIWLARMLPEDGILVSLELNEQYSLLAQSNIQRAGLAGKIEIRTGPAIESLQNMNGKEEPFDFIFIDADKPPYTEYFIHALSLSRAGTIIVADNVVRNGKVLDGKSTDPAVLGVRRFLEYLSSCDKVDSTILQNVGVKEYDGMSVSIVK